MSTRTGQFRLADGRSVFGELRIAGRRSLLTLRDDKEPLAVSPDGCITGILHDAEHVTLLDCIVTAVSSKGFSGDQRIHSAEMMPQFIVAGRRQLMPDDACVIEIGFSFEDAAAIFYDFDAFGTLFDGSAFIEGIVAAKKLKRPIEIGPEAPIAYFTGKSLILKAATRLGEITAQHNPSCSSGGPDGVRIDNHISVSIAPPSPLTIQKAVDLARQLLRFFDLATGRRQTVPVLSAAVRHENRTEWLEVHWSHHPIRIDDAVGGSRRPHPGDVPLDGVRRADEFARVIAKWLDSDCERRDSRARFNDLLERPWHYTVNGLVSAANMFDILPESAVPKKVEISKEIGAAKLASEELFRPFKNSDEGSSILNALGRIGSATLKQKVRHRASYILAVNGEGFKDLPWVCDRAIDCRNYLVHGTATKMDFWADVDTFPFLTDTLKFVFAGSELVEAGWDMQRFLLEPTSMSHFMGEYKVMFRDRVGRLRKSLKPA